MASKTIMLRLPEKVAEQVQKIADKQSIGISTAVRIMICERFNEEAEGSKGRK
jgi:antitoxin component of RelBE/YafQ-DinJ toxin-antitoxin module